jgi:plasmid stabilization system protein ParE
MRLVITAAAKADLLAIRRTIGADNPSRALSFVEELLDRCLVLADTPKAYPLVTRFVLEALAKHERTAFLSGNDRVDLYFREMVSQDVKRKYATCYVLIERNTDKGAGIYTLSAHSIPLNDLAPELAKKLPRYPSVPVVLIGWMGRDLAFRGAGVGSLLLYDAISRVAKALVGAYAICADAIADAIDQLAAAFYRDHQFQPLASRP